MRYFTDMRSVFDALPGICTRYDWLISDLDCNWQVKEVQEGNHDERLDARLALITGEELNEILRSHEIQFIWAVFSALPKGTKPEFQAPPYADGNPNFWIGSPKPQFPTAAMEIVCWDSGSTLLIGITADMATGFKGRFPEAIDLDEYNRQQLAKQEPTLPSSQP